MAKELFFYQGFNRWSALELNKNLSELDRTSDIVIRLNSPGGDVVGGDAVIAMLNEFTGKKTAIIDGEVASMAAILLLYFDEVIANDHGYETIMFHKATFNSWYEPTDEEKKELQKVNDSFMARLTKKVTGKIGSEDFLATLFEDGKRNEVKLTANKAKQLGIVTEVRKIEPTAYSGMSIVAMIDNTPTTKVEPTINEKPKRMEITQAQLEAARKEGFDAGVQAEFDRAGSFLAWAEIDPKEAIEGATTFGAKVTATKIAKFQIAAMKSNRLEAHKEDNTPPNGITPENPAKGEMTAEQKETATIEAEMKEMRKLAGLQ